MTSALRLSVILVLVLASAALALIAYNASQSRPAVAAAPSVPPPVTVSYYVAAHSLPVGTLARDEDFETRTASSAELPAGAIQDSPTAKIELRGSLVRRFLDTGRAVTANDVLRPRDRGFLASVLAPDTRAISINVDSESGVSGLIWPGDYVDVVLTQAGPGADGSRRSLSEIVLHNVRIIAIDQEIVEGAHASNTVAGKLTHSVSLQLTPDQVKKIMLAKDIGKLSLAIRSAVEQHATADAGTMYGCDVSPEIARQTEMARQQATVVVYSGEKAKEFTVKKDRPREQVTLVGCNSAEKLVHQGGDVASATSAKSAE